MNVSAGIFNRVYPASAQCPNKSRASIGGRETRWLSRHLPRCVQRNDETAPPAPAVARWRVLGLLPGRGHILHKTGYRKLKHRGGEGPENFERRCRAAEKHGRGY